MDEHLIYRIQAGLLMLGSLMFLGFGLFFLLAPEALAEMAGLSFHSNDSIAEIRAFYGGLELGIGLFLLWIVSAAKIEVLRRAGILAMVFMFGGSAVGRLSHWICSGHLGSVQTALMVFEFGYAIICAWSLWYKPRLSEEPVLD